MRGPMAFPPPDTMRHVGIELKKLLRTLCKKLYRKKYQGAETENSTHDSTNGHPPQSNPNQLYHAFL
jgi:hypothetical protein